MKARQLVLTILAALLAAGCGGGDDDPPPAGVAAQSAPQLALSIAEPASGATASGSRVLVAGMVTTSAGKVTVNGRAACIAGTRFYVNDMELSGSTNVNAVASSASGAASAAVRMVKAIQPKALRVSGNDACEHATPYDASFDLAPEGFAALQVAGVEADFDGDGVVDYKARELPSQLSHTYLSAGLFRARFTVKLFDGSRIDTWRYQSIVTLADSTSQLDETVKGLSTAFKAQDVGKALTYLTPDAQSKHGWALTAFKDHLPALAAGIANARPSVVGEDRAAYEVAVTQGPSIVIYNIIFIKDANGVWKIDSL